LLVLAAVPYGAHVLEEFIARLRGVDGTSLGSLAWSSSVWTLVGCAVGAAVLFFRTRSLAAPSS